MRSTTVHFYPEDIELIELLQKHFLEKKIRLKDVQIIRAALRRLAETEGIIPAGYKAS